jgi:Zinc-uptake complex component A periplasmic
MLPGVAAADDKIKVVATFTVIADMVTNIAGDLVDLVTIVGPDTDCEEYEPPSSTTGTGRLMIATSPRGGRGGGCRKNRGTTPRIACRTGD